MRAILPLLLTATALAACAGTSASNAVEPSPAAGFDTAPIATFNAPWAMTYLPDGRMLVTEKAGALLLVTGDGAQRMTVGGTPMVDAAGQGGLMDVVLHPQFATNRLVYLSWSEAANGGKLVALGRGRLVERDGGAMLEAFTILRRGSPAVAGNGHYSGRIAFSRDGHLFWANGDRQKMTPAQDKGVTLGKLLRLNDDGSPAANNPFAAQGGDPAIWTMGHRNILGIAFDANGRLWQQEMGPAGGDEVNLVEPGRNYGWPNTSNGSHYDGRDIPDHRDGDGYAAPRVWWNPAISPGGLIVYSGKMWPQWRGDLFIGGLSSEALIRVDTNGADATKGDQWPMGARIREVEEAPDGAIMLLEDGPGARLLRLTPKR